MEAFEKFREVAERHVKEYIDAIALCQRKDSAYFGVIGVERLKYHSWEKWSEKCVVLLLESPHICEYDFKAGLKCKGVAMGATGRMIATYGGEVFSRFRGWSLYLLNAVPFQCSLGMNLKLSSALVKDKIVDEMLHEHVIQLSLEGNLLKLLRGKSAVIVNACGGSARRRSDVAAVIKSCKDVCNFESVVCPHPSRWFDMRVRAKAITTMELAYKNYREKIQSIELTK